MAGLVPEDPSMVDIDDGHMDIVFSHFPSKERPGQRLAKG